MPTRTAGETPNEEGGASSSVYILGRALGVAGRPVFLLSANNLLGGDAARDVAASFVLVSLAMLVTAADAHRLLYSRYFADPPTRVHLVFHVYGASQVWLSCLGVLSIVVLSRAFPMSWLVVLSTAAYFCSEKLADEVLRLRLFEQRLETWGRLLTARTILQISGLVAVLAVAGDGDGSLAVWILAVGNIVVFTREARQVIWWRLDRVNLRVGRWLLRRGLVHLWNRRSIWAMALIGASIGYLDRVTALVIDPLHLPVFLMVVMCFSVIQLAIDFFYLAPNRRGFLRHHLSVSTSLLSRGFVAALLGGLTVALMATAVVLRVADGGGTLPWGYVVALASLHLALAAALIPREIVYWSRDVHRILRVEGLFWIALLAGYGLCLGVGLSRDSLIAVAAVGAVVRLATYVVLAWTVHGPRSDTETTRLSVSTAE